MHGLHLAHVLNALNAALVVIYRQCTLRFAPPPWGAVIPSLSYLPKPTNHAKPVAWLIHPVPQSPAIAHAGAGANVHELGRRGSSTYPPPRAVHVHRRRQVKR
jgi:hypothetical protein